MSRVARAAGLLAVLGATACGQDITGIGGGQILAFHNDLARPVTFLYCPEQGCASPLSRLVQPRRSWRIANETINGSGAVSLRVGRSLSGCRLVPAVGVLDDPVSTYQATFVRGGPPCVRPG
ncbi:MAG: hypothetical protein ACTHK4_01350 [Mycobacteriales bacterium]